MGVTARKSASVDRNLQEDASESSVENLRLLNREVKSAMERKESFGWQWLAQSEPALSLGRPLPQTPLSRQLLNTEG